MTTQSSNRSGFTSPGLLHPNRFMAGWQSRFLGVFGLVILAAILGACNLYRQATPTQEPGETTVPGTGSIQGVIWQDSCLNDPAADNPPPGCVPGGSLARYHANGVRDSGELPLTDLQLGLGDGSCPTEGFVETRSGPQGEFRFSGLAPGSYCLRLDPEDEDNRKVLGEGWWTAPNRLPGDQVLMVTVRIQPGGTEALDIGWDPAGQPQVQATVTAGPSPTPTCSHRVGFVRDVTIPDRTLMPPGEAFTKTWRLQNLGTCPWTTEFQLTFVDGHPMSGPGSVPLRGAVKVGETVDLSVSLRAPTSNGTYKGFWMMRTSDGRLFGLGEDAFQPFWVEIVVGPTPTPLITDWRAEYFSNRTLAGPPALVRNEQKIDHNWGSGSPGTQVPKDNFSARWTRSQWFEGATYRFRITVDDGVRLWIDDRLVLDDWRDGPSRTHEFSLSMTRGSHPIKLEYYERTGAAVMRLNWDPLTSPTYSDWRGQYWFAESFQSPWALVRNDPAIDFDWGEGSPDAAIPVNGFSARWDRQVTFSPGQYRFYAQSDDGVRVFLDNALIIDEWHLSSGEQIYQTEVTVQGTRRVQVDYFERAGRAKVKVWWELLGPTTTPTATTTGTASPSPTPTATPTATPTLTPTLTFTPTATQVGGNWDPYEFTDPPIGFRLPGSWLVEQDTGVVMAYDSRAANIWSLRVTDDRSLPREMNQLVDHLVQMWLDRGVTDFQLERLLVGIHVDPDGWASIAFKKVPEACIRVYFPTSETVYQLELQSDLANCASDPPEFTDLAMQMLAWVHPIPTASDLDR